MYVGTRTMHTPPLLAASGNWHLHTNPNYVDTVLPLGMAGKGKGSHSSGKRKAAEAPDYKNKYKALRAEYKAYEEEAREKNTILLEENEKLKQGVLSDFACSHCHITEIRDPVENPKVVFENHFPVFQPVENPEVVFENHFSVFHWVTDFLLQKRRSW